MVFQAALLVDPPLVLPVPRVVSVDQARVLWVSVPPGLPHLYSLEGRYLGREGTQTNPLPARRLRQLLLERGVVQFEAQVPPGAVLEDLDDDKVQAYLQTLDLPGGVPAEEILLRRGCLKRVNPHLAPTYAALLLFGSHPQQWLPNATILAARFSGANFADRYIKQDIAGTLPDQLRQAEAFARENIRSVVRLMGLTHQDTPEYPLEAVRELLVNAVAHRDYNQQGDTIHLNIFADRLEVHSPGGLPGPVTLENLLEARFSRNAVIVQVLSDLGFVERLGYGLDRVMSVSRQYDLRTPRFEEVGGSFRVTLFGSLESGPTRTTDSNLQAYRDLGLNPRQESALGYVVKHRRITNRDFQEICPDVHPETLRRDLADLVTRDVLIKVGDKRATYYILK
jgi:ATP-dependent DNA helicase RecG